VSQNGRDDGIGTAALPLDLADHHRTRLGQRMDQAIDRR
jgi:hypothetical protein